MSTTKCFILNCFPLEVASQSQNSPNPVHQEHPPYSPNTILPSPLTRLDQTTLETETTWPRVLITTRHVCILSLCLLPGLSGSISLLSTAPFLRPLPSPLLAHSAKTLKSLYNQQRSKQGEISKQKESKKRICKT